MARRPVPPSLGPAGLRVWREVTAAYELSPAELETLRQVAHTVDVIAWTQEQLTGEPLTTTGSTGQPVANPLLGVLADQRRTLEVMFRSLSLPMPDEVSGRRRSPQAIEAAREKWRQQKRTKVV